MMDSIDDFFMGVEQKYIFESMLFAAENCGFLAVIGEAGAGKSLLPDMLSIHVQIITLWTLDKINSANHISHIEQFVRRSGIMRPCDTKTS
ncbi:MAG: hypothetical protein GY862_17310 [Gammaproteobacteria bacterium]|nr:hypothetical protein [Gammaproteobacteria bacterium]